MTGWIQVVSMDIQGTMQIDKFGVWVRRMTNGVVTTGPSFMKVLALVVSLLAFFVSDNALFAGTLPARVIGWGNSWAGKTHGFTSLESSASVTEIGGNALNDAIAIAAGMNHLLALRADGAVVGWGFNGHGAATAPGDLTNAVAIAAGNNFSVALRADGTVAAWGLNQDGQTNVPASATNVIAISAGPHHALALRRDGTVVRWGRQTDKMPNLTNIVAIAAGGSNFERNLALKRGGTVIAWGGNYSEPPSGLTNVAAIAVGEHHSLALKYDGTVVGWGGNGSGEATGVPTPERPWVTPGGLVTLGGQVLTNVTAIAAGNEYGLIGSACRYSLALQRDGSVAGWGVLAGHEVPVPIGLTNVTALAAGLNFCLAITTNNPVPPPTKTQE